MTNIDIHADDYAYSLETSKDIIDCIKEGNLDSFSIICNMKCFDTCMDLLKKEIPSFDYLPNISIHINLPEGIGVSSIIPKSWFKLFLMSYSIFKNRYKEEIKKEIKNQIEVTQKEIDECIEIAKKNNIKVTQEGMRIDSHIHTHLLPIVWESLVEVIEEENYKIEYIRNPKEPILPFFKHLDVVKTYSLVNIIKNRILMLYSKKVDNYLDLNKIDKMYMCGLILSGHMDYDRLKIVYPDLLEYAEKNNRKLVLLFHPGKAKEDEYSSEMDKNYFRDANSSENRHIEKDTVMKIKSIIN